MLGGKVEQVIFRLSKTTKNKTKPQKPQKLLGCTSYYMYLEYMSLRLSTIYSSLLEIIARLLPVPSTIFS